MSEQDLQQLQLLIRAEVGVLRDEFRQGLDSAVEAMRVEFKQRLDSGVEAVRDEFRQRLDRAVEAVTGNISDLRTELLRELSTVNRRLERLETNVNVILLQTAA